ncbi:hypothetical protein B0H17DRAFT_1291507 [Mycena rosella]|uniref:Uncharacterized protein n=1 Tax=Mycena rosella TaxID=1033263 RepID=A0AAD7DFD5_MYCRO|nr:hypothetical protein B0H17DRAFT_1291507 [Mycena rosella]
MAIFDPTPGLFHQILVRLHIPRINFHFQPHGFDFTVLRKQVPLTLCYATTFTGCQGPTRVSLSKDWALICAGRFSPMANFIRR